MLPPSPPPQQQQPAAAPQPAQQLAPTPLLQQGASLAPLPLLLPPLQSMAMPELARQPAPSLQQSMPTPQLAQRPLSASTPMQTTAAPLPTAASAAQLQHDSGNVQAAEMVHSPARQTQGHNGSISSQQQRAVSSATVLSMQLSSGCVNGSAANNSQPAAVGVAQAGGEAHGSGLQARVGGSGSTDGQRPLELLDGEKPPSGKKRPPFEDGFDIVCDFFGIERPMRRPRMIP